MGSALGLSLGVLTLASGIIMADRGIAGDTNARPLGLLSCAGSGPGTVPKR